MKIVFVIPDMGSGGAERVISILSSEMVRKGYDVHILMLFGTRIHYDLPASVNVEDINLMSLPLLKRINRLRCKLKEISNGDRLIIYSFHDSCLKYALAASIGLNRRIICSERNNPYIKGIGFKDKIRASIPYLLCDHVVFQTEDARRYYSLIPNSKCSIIPNPIIPTKYKWYETVTPEKLVSVCRLHYQKNLPMTIEVISILKNKYPNIHIDIYGEGELKEELNDLIIKKGLTKNVELKGTVKNVTERLAESSVFISTSDFEGISNSMLEAMSVGMPIVCTDCPIGGAKMMLGNGAGLLSPIKNAQEFAIQLVSILENPSLAKELGKTALQKSKEYSPQNITEKWLEIIKK